MEIARKENVRCDPENMGESIQGECLENSVKAIVKNVRCAKNVGEEKCIEVQCDQTEMYDVIKKRV